MDAAKSLVDALFNDMVLFNEFGTSKNEEAVYQSQRFFGTWDFEALQGAVTEPSIGTSCLFFHREYPY